MLVGSDLNGCPSNPFPEGVASNTNGGPDQAGLGDPMDFVLMRGDDLDAELPLKMLDLDDSNEPGLLSPKLIVTAQLNLNSTQLGVTR